MGAALPPGEPVKPAVATAPPANASPAVVGDPPTLFSSQPLAISGERVAEWVLG